MSTYNKPTPTKATTLADLVDTKTGGKRKRIDTHVEGIPLGAIVDGAAKAPAQRVVRTPRRMATAAPEVSARTTVCVCRPLTRPNSPRRPRPRTRRTSR